MATFLKKSFTFISAALLQLFIASNAFSTSSTEVTHPLTRVQQRVSQTSLPSFSGMVEANVFAGNPANKCHPSNTRDLCFVQLTTPHIGASTTLGTNSCPENYAPSMSFGNKVTLNGTNTVVVYTLEDIHPKVDQTQSDLYKTQHYYSCNADNNIPITTNITSTNSSSPYSLDGYYMINNIYMHLEQIVQTAKDCYTRPHVAAGNNICNNGRVVGAYWEYKFDMKGKAITCIRNAGFYPPNPANSSNPLASEGTEFSPTIVICGKIYPSWRTKP